MTFFHFILTTILLNQIFPNQEMPGQSNSLPNIIYILADDLGYGDLSCYNEESKIFTPNIDALAAEGILFTDAHSSSSVCTPTRYSILTGRYNWRSPLKSGVLTGKSKALIPPTRTTVASLLKKNGYNTAFIGKWHLGWDWAQTDTIHSEQEGWDAKDFDDIDFAKAITNGPKELGFDYSFGHSASLDMAPYVYVENGLATMIPDSVSLDSSRYGWWRKGPTSADFDHQDVTPNFFRRAGDYIRANSQSKKPFFLYLALPSPHTPILPGAKWRGKSQLNPYGDFMMMIDDLLGELISTTKKLGIEKNTIIIFTSDNGCSPAANIQLLKEKGHHPSYIYRGHKADIFEGGHRVPFILKWPEKIPGGKSIDKTICQTDFFATCAELTGYEIKEDEGEDSFSMLSFFEKESIRGNHREATVHHSINGSFAIRKDQWKLILCDDSGGWSEPTPAQSKENPAEFPFQLYDLSLDPGEENNLYRQFPEKVNELKKLLLKYIQEGRSTPGKPQKNDPFNGEWKQLTLLK